MLTDQKPGALSIQPKIPEISVGTSNGTDHFGLVRPEYSGPALKVVHFNRSRRLRRSDPNVPFHLTKLLSPVPLFCILLTRTIKRAVDWVGSVKPECTVPLDIFLKMGSEPIAHEAEGHSGSRNYCFSKIQLVGQ